MKSNNDIIQNFKYTPDRYEPTIFHVEDDRSTTVQ